VFTFSASTQDVLDCKKTLLTCTDDNKYDFHNTHVCTAVNWNNCDRGHQENIAIYC